MRGASEASDAIFAILKPSEASRAIVVSERGEFLLPSLIFAYEFVRHKLMLITDRFTPEKNSKEIVLDPRPGRPSQGMSFTLTQVHLCQADTNEITGNTQRKLWGICDS